MYNKEDFPNAQKLELLSDLFLRFYVGDDIIKEEFVQPIFKQIGLLCHDLQRAADRASIITDFIVSITKIVDQFEKTKLADIEEA